MASSPFNYIRRLVLRGKSLDMTTVEETKSLLTTSKEFREKLEDTNIIYCRMGVPVCLFNNEGKPINVPPNTDLKNYTVKDSINAIKDNANDWKNRSMYNINGIYVLTGLVKEGKLNGKYFIGIETDTEKAYNTLLNGTTIEDFVAKFKWVEHHTKPYYKIHIFVVTDKPLPYLKETTIVDKDGNSLGLGVFSEHNQWFASSPSVNHRSNCPWELLPNGIKSLDVLSDELYNELYQRIEHLCKTIGGFDYGKEIKPPVIYKEEKTAQEGNQSNNNTTNINDEVSDFYDTPTTNFCEYVTSCFVPYFEEPNRDKIVFILSGFFAKERINIKITKKIVELLQEKHNEKFDIRDREIIGSRTRVIVNSYKKVDNGDKVEGYSAIKVILGEELSEQLEERVQGFCKFYNTESRIQDLYEVTALDIMSNYPTLTLRESLNSDNKDEILIYNNGYYNKEKSIKEIIHSLYPFEFKRNDVNEIVEYIKYANVVNREACDTNLHIINTENGLYNYKSKELLPHDPKYPSLIQIPIAYDKTKKCPNFLKFINESVTPSDRGNCLNGLAYIFHRRNDKEVLNFLVGEGYNGKSLLISVMTHLLGDRNVSNVSLDRILNDPYVESSMLGKLVNFAPDTKVLTAEDMTKLKIIAGKQRTTIEKKYQDSHEGALNIKLFFPINRIGEINDDSDGYHRRPNYSVFPQKYKDELSEEEKNDPLQEYKLANPKLEKTLKEESQGIFNLLIEYLNKLEEKNFRFGNSANQNREKYDLLQNRIPIFVKERIEFDNDYNHTKYGYRQMFEYKDFIFTQLDKFCKEKEIPTPSKKTLGEYLRKQIESRYKNPTNKNEFSFDGKRVNETNGRKEYVYYGIRFLDKDERERKEKEMEEEEKGEMKSIESSQESSMELEDNRYN